MTKQEDIQITPAEWEVMRILWDAGKPLTAAEVTQSLAGVASWKPKTVRTFLNRLVGKNAISATKQMIAGYELLHYQPLLEERAVVRAEQENFLSRFFGGTIQSMLAGCIQSGEIGKEELQQLRDLIDREVRKEET